MKLLRRLGARFRTRKRRARTIPKRRSKSPRAMCLSLYARSNLSSDRISAFSNESAHVPAYESRALNGQRAPHRFQWRGRWYRVVDTAAMWGDSRRASKASPMAGRTYFSVLTADGKQFQLSYQPPLKRHENGSWTVYRQVTYRPSSKSIDDARKRS